MKNKHTTFVTGRSRGKMARKKKKQFIKKNGRDLYKIQCTLASLAKQFLDSIPRKPNNRCFEKEYWGNCCPDYGYGRQIYVNINM